MNKKRITIILIMIVFLPLFFFGIYEITSFNQSINLINQIYDSKLNSVLFSINQYFLDRINNISADLSSRMNTIQDEQTLSEIPYFEGQPADLKVFLADSSFSDIALFENNKRQSIHFKKTFTDTLQANRFIAERLIHRKKIGYPKPESFLMQTDSDLYLVVAFALDHISEPHTLAGFMMPVSTILNNYIRPKISEFQNQGVIAAVFYKDDDDPLITSGEINAENVKRKKNLWLLPDYYVGIRLEEDRTLENLAQNRLERTLILLSLLTLILIFGAWMLYKNVRRQMELAQIKSDFVSNVSHELRTPLSLIRMFAESLSMDRVKSPDKQKEYYHIITKETIRLTHLINNILDFSKMESSKKQFNVKRCDLNAVVRECMNLYQFHLQSEGFQYKCNYDKRSLFVLADAEAINETLINLLDNSVKYSTENKEITITTGQKEKTAFIQISDKGMGIKSHEQKRIFDKFYRVSEGSTHNIKGSGLGLALVNYTMQAHGGRVTVSSIYGKGSTFTLHFALMPPN